MRVSTGHIYKPDRIVYYVEPTIEEKQAFYKGVIPEALVKYVDYYGTYDYPELFKLKQGDGVLEVIGIEFRPEDKDIDYPTDLKSLSIKQGFMVSVLFTEDEYIDDGHVANAVRLVNEKLESKPLLRVVKPQKNPDIIQVSTYHNHNRCLIRANDITAEEFFRNVKPQTDTENKLYNAAFIDPITNHYNWSYMWPILSGYGLAGIKDFAFVYFDIKDFKALNVVYGHDIANHVLSRAARHMDEMDWVYLSARCDNDNFAMMIKDMPEEECRQKLESFFEDISLLEDDPSYHIYYRCGVVPMKNSLLIGDRVADAGKQVQRMGGKLYETEILFYTHKMQDDLEWSTKIKAYLDTAIENDEFLVYLQPKYDINSEKLHGAEALIRWKYHGRDLISPGRFIPVFETGGLINKLDDIVLKKVCEYLNRWKSEGKELYPISVNLSRKRFSNPNLVEYLTNIVDSYGIDHSLIDFEVTESAVYDNQNVMINVITELKNKGFRISMDDFGTGYSSLGLLTVMPIDTLKIDKSFVDGISEDEADYKNCAVIKHIITMAKDLDFTCLAEGAEEKSQVDLLRQFGCEIVQGYYYSKPLPVEEYEKKLMHS